MCTSPSTSVILQDMHTQHSIITMQNILLLNCYVTWGKKLNADKYFGHKSSSLNCPPGKKSSTLNCQLAWGKKFHPWSILWAQMFITQLSPNMTFLENKKIPLNWCLVKKFIAELSFGTVLKFFTELSCSHVHMCKKVHHWIAMFALVHWLKFIA